MPENVTLAFAPATPCKQAGSVNSQPNTVTASMKLDRKLRDLKATLRAAQKWLRYDQQRISLLDRLKQAEQRLYVGSDTEYESRLNDWTAAKHQVARVEAEMKRLEHLHGIREIKRICGIYQGVRNGAVVDHESFLRGQLIALNEIRWRV